LVKPQAGASDDWAQLIAPPPTGRYGAEATLVKTLSLPTSADGTATFADVAALARKQQEAIGAVLDDKDPAALTQAAAASLGWAGLAAVRSPQCRNALDLGRGVAHCPGHVRP
jgi:hypothetical protein